MLHLLDANVLFDANRDYYPIKRVPEFWDWLAHHASEGRVKVPLEVYEEVEDDDHGVGDWISQDSIRKVLLLDEASDVNHVRTVVRAYAPDLRDDEVEELGRDPFLIAYAFRDKVNRIVVTSEVSKPSMQRKNRRVPDVCKDLGVKCCKVFDLTNSLNFSTDWRSQLSR